MGATPVPRSTLVRQVKAETTKRTAPWPVFSNDEFVVRIAAVYVERVGSRLLGNILEMNSAWPYLG